MFRRYDDTGPVGYSCGHVCGPRRYDINTHLQIYPYGDESSVEMNKQHL